MEMKTEIIKKKQLQKVTIAMATARAIAIATVRATFATDTKCCKTPAKNYFNYSSKQLLC